MQHMRAGGDDSKRKARQKDQQRRRGESPQVITRRDGSISVPANTDSLAVLLAAFFRFYAFEFNMGAHVVCPRLGRTKWLSKDGVDRRMRAPRKWRFAVEDVRPNALPRWLLRALRLSRVCLPLLAAHPARPSHPPPSGIAHSRSKLRTTSAP